jgi:hypothetical protein
MRQRRAPASGPTRLLRASGPSRRPKPLRSDAPLEEIRSPGQALAALLLRLNAVGSELRLTAPSGLKAPVWHPAPRTVGDACYARSAQAQRRFPALRGRKRRIRRSAPPRRGLASDPRLRGRRRRARGRARGSGLLPGRSARAARRSRFAVRAGRSTRRRAGSRGPGRCTRARRRARQAARLGAGGWRR